MREGLSPQLGRQLVEELGQRAQRSGSNAVGDDEVDGLADGQDLRGVLVGDAHAIGVLELLDERVEVEGVGLEVLLEAGLLGDAVAVDLELVGEVVAHQGEDLVPGHEPLTLAASADAAGGLARSAPAASSASWVRSTTCSCTPRSAARIEFATPRRVKRPWQTTASLRRPSR